MKRKQSIRALADLQARHALIRGFVEAEKNPSKLRDHKAELEIIAQKLQLLRLEVLGEVSQRKAA